MHPFFWAGLIGIGDMNPIIFHDKYSKKK